MAMLTDYQKMQSACEYINTSAEEFTSKATNFIVNLTAALSTFEGAAKDSLIASKIGQSGSDVEGTLACFVEKQIPSLLTGMKNLLNGNLETIVQTDQKLADAIEGKSEG